VNFSKSSKFKRNSVFETDEDLLQLLKYCMKRLGKLWRKFVSFFFSFPQVSFYTIRIVFIK